MKKIKKHFVNFLIAQRKLFKIVSNVINIAALVVLVLWVLDCKLEFYGEKYDQEPIFTILMTASVSVHRIYIWLLNEAEYSPSHALAVGYFSNFLSPVITQLTENGEKPKIWIYKPEHIEELFRDSVDRMKASLENRQFTLETITLDLHHARTRDILTIQKSKRKRVYFDFPNTLLSLQNYVDYKIGSKSNRSSDEAKKKLMLKLMDRFYIKIQELAKKEGVDGNICWCDKNLQIEF